MADVFYQGEDISLQIEIFNDDSMDIKTNVADVEVDMLVYTKHGGKEIKLSSHTINDDIILIKKDIENNILSTTIPASVTKMMTAGLMTVEMMTIENINEAIESRRISVSSHIHIQPSKIGV